MGNNGSSPLGDMSVNEIKTLGDAVGMPDEQDKETLRRILLKWDKHHPGVIAYTIKNARQEMYENSSAMHDVKTLGIVEKRGLSSTNRALIFELPEGLTHEIEKVFPTIFRDRKHFAWFVKNFPELMVPDKYEARTGFKK